jgi:hypothetical protein
VPPTGAAAAILVFATVTRGTAPTTIERSWE